MAVASDEVQRTDPAGRRRLGEWTPVEAHDELGRVVRLLVAPDDARPGRHQVVREAPALRRLPSGAPALSISFAAERAPRTDEGLDVVVRHCVLAVDLDMAPPAAALDELNSRGGEYVPLFAQRLDLRLVRGADTTLASESFAGWNLGGALQATLERSDALDVLRALGGAATDLQLEAAVEYRAAAADDVRYRVRFGAAEMYDRMQRFGGGALLYEADLIHLLATSLSDGMVAAEPAFEGDQDQARQLAAALLPAFLQAASIFLEPASDASASSLGDAYRLGPRPHEGVVLSARRSGSASGGTDSIAGSIALDRLLGETLTHDQLDRHVHVVVLGGSDGGAQPLPRLVKARARSMPAGAMNDLVVADSRQVSTQWRALRPARLDRPAAHVMLASGAAQVLGNTATPAAALIAQGVHLWALPDGQGSVEDRRPGPVVDRGEQAVWPDRWDDAKRWYAPTFSMVAPDPATATLEDSPFVFRFRRVGFDAQGRPGLEARVRLTLRRQMPEATTAEWESQGRPAISAVPTDGLSVELQLPYRRPDGVVATQALGASTIEEREDLLVAEFQLLDDWARVCYAALGTASGSEFAARLSVAYSFGGWSTRPLRPPLGAATLHLAQPLINRNTRSREPDTAPTLRLRAGRLEAVMPLATVAASTVVVRPEVAVRPEIATLLEQTQHWWRTYGRTSLLDASMPCASLGRLYVEDGTAGPRPVGCQEPVLLGQAPTQTYEQVPIASAPSGTRVLRSLVSPGRFVIVPAAYRIGRYEPTEGERAYRPTVMLYSTIDIEQPANTQCILSVALQPDLTPARRRRIEAELRSQHHPSPIVEDITALPAEIQFAWALPGSAGGWSINAETVRTWDGFQVAMTTNAAGILALQAILTRSGVTGSASIALGTDAAVDVDLRIDLTRIVGPAQAGALEHGRDRGTLTLANRIETRVAVSEVYCVTGDSLAVIPVEEVIGPGQQLDVALPAGTEAAYADYTSEPTPASLTEIRAYVEDIAAEVIVLNLADLGRLNLVSLEVTAKIAGTSGDQSAVLTADAPTARLSYVLPLTVFAADPLLEYRVTRTGVDGQSQSTPWLPWRLSGQGHVISLTQEVIEAS